MELFLVYFGQCVIVHGRQLTRGLGEVCVEVLHVSLRVLLVGWKLVIGVRIVSKKRGPVSWFGLHLFGLVSFLVTHPDLAKLEQATYHLGHEWGFHAHLLHRLPVDATKKGLLVDVACLTSGHAHSLGWLSLQ